MGRCSRALRAVNEDGDLCSTQRRTRVQMFGTRAAHHQRANTQHAAGVQTRGFILASYCPENKNLETIAPHFIFWFHSARPLWLLCGPEIDGLSSVCAAALIHTNKPNRGAPPWFQRAAVTHFLTRSESTESSSDSAKFNLCNLVSVQQLHTGHMIRLNTFK